MHIRTIHKPFLDTKWYQTHDYMTIPKSHHHKNHHHKIYEKRSQTFIWNGQSHKAMIIAFPFLFGSVSDARPHSCANSPWPSEARWRRPSLFFLFFWYITSVWYFCFIFWLYQKTYCFFWYYLWSFIAIVVIFFGGGAWCCNWLCYIFARPTHFCAQDAQVIWLNIGNILINIWIPRVVLWKMAGLEHFGFKDVQNQHFLSQLSRRSAWQFSATENLSSSLVSLWVAPQPPAKRPGRRTGLQQPQCLLRRRGTRFGGVALFGIGGDLGALSSQTFPTPNNINNQKCAATWGTPGFPEKHGRLLAFGLVWMVRVEKLRWMARPWCPAPCGDGPSFCHDCWCQQYATVHLKDLFGMSLLVPKQNLDWQGYQTFSKEIGDDITEEQAEQTGCSEHFTAVLWACHWCKLCMSKPEWCAFCGRRLSHLTLLANWLACAHVGFIPFWLSWMSENIWIQTKSN